jgi:gamma-glutamyltranspeptidase/glutathione hydrolase
VGGPEAKRFPRACVASPHYLASSAGLAVLSSGGNALDAAIATNLTLGVVTPYVCGYGGDLFAMVWAEGELHGYNGSGRAPAGATTDAVRAALGGAGEMPYRGPHTVTVPGAVRGWFDLLERFGTLSFGALAERARRYASDGFVPTETAAASFARARTIFVDSKEWQAVYGEARAGAPLRQPALARTVETLAEEGPDPYYRGAIAEAIAGHLASLGSLMTVEDLAAHHGDWVRPLSAPYRDVEILEMPPNSQGVVALEALGVAEALGAMPPDGGDRQHLLIEAVKLALADRAAFVTDPGAMSIPPERLVSRRWTAERAGSFDPRMAAAPAPGAAATGGTVYVCAGDADGMLVSLIQSNYAGFGSGVTVPEWGINLQNRGASFSLDPEHANAIAPGKRTMHTLMPAMARRDGRPWLVFGTMGGDGQAQTHVQFLARIVDDREDLQRAIDAPRWMVSPRDWTVTAERRFDPSILDGLRKRGHELAVVGDHDSLVGHAHAIRITPNGYEGATDPRAEGAVMGF